MSVWRPWTPDERANYIRLLAVLEVIGEDASSDEVWTALERIGRLATMAIELQPELSRDWMLAGGWASTAGRVRIPIGGDPTLNRIELDVDDQKRMVLCLGAGGTVLARVPAAQLRDGANRALSN